MANTSARLYSFVVFFLFVWRKNRLQILALTSVFLLVLHPFSSLAIPASFEAQKDKRSEERWVGETESKNQDRTFGSLPKSQLKVPRRAIVVPVTAYASEVWQTDASPFITASGTHVRRGIVAANFLPIGTKIRLPEFYGNEVFVVEDRMHSRYTNHVDIWMESSARARQFGLKWTEIEVY